MVDAAMMLPFASRTGETVQRDMQDAAVFGATSGLEVLDLFSVLQLFKDVPHFVRTIWWQQDGDIFADHFLCTVAVHTFGGLVPRQYRSVEGLAENGIVGVFDDGREQAVRIQLVYRIAEFEIPNEARVIINFSEQLLRTFVFAEKCVSMGERFWDTARAGQKNDRD